MSIVSALDNLNSNLPDNITLVAVSKTKPNDDILKAFEAGQRHFGENKVQEITTKSEELPKEIKWHFIGHLQSNKVKFIVPFVHLIHGVDSLKLIKEINKRAANVDRVVDCLLQLSIADEESKFGFDKENIFDNISNGYFETLKNVNIRGMMGMATNTIDTAKIKSEFEYLKKTFDQTADLMKKDEFSILSMGMTNDYEIAIEAGSNMVRIGSAIFGARNLK